MRQKDSVNFYGEIKDRNKLEALERNQETLVNRLPALTSQHINITHHITTCNICSSQHLRVYFEILDLKNNRRKYVNTKWLSTTKGKHNI